MLSDLTEAFANGKQLIIDPGLLARSASGASGPMTWSPLLGDMCMRYSTRTFLANGLLLPHKAKCCQGGCNRSHPLNGGRCFQAFSRILGGSFFLIQDIKNHSYLLELFLSFCLPDKKFTGDCLPHRYI